VEQPFVANLGLSGKEMIGLLPSGHAPSRERKKKRGLDKMKIQLKKRTRGKSPVSTQKIRVAFHLGNEGRT